jgi:hypothetical protein
MSAGIVGGYARAMSVPAGIFVPLNPPSGLGTTPELKPGPITAVLGLIETTSKVGSTDWDCDGVSGKRVEAVAAVSNAKAAITVRMWHSPFLCFLISAFLDGVNEFRRASACRESRDISLKRGISLGIARRTGLTSCN